MAKVSLSSRFAHLIGLNPSASRPATTTPAVVPAAAKPAEGEDDDSEEDPERAQKEGESDEDYAKRLAKMDGDDENCESEEGDDKDKEKREKEARAAGVVEGAAAEKARWTEVFASAEAAGRVPLACTLLAETDMNAAAVVKALAATPVQSAKPSLADRHARESIPQPKAGEGADPANANSDAAWAQNVMATADQFRGKKLANAK